MTGNKRRELSAGVEVHTAGRRDLDARVPALPEAGRRRAVAGTERAGERFMGLVARVERDLRDRARAGGELPRRALHPQPPDELERRLADHAAEDAMEMERREACAARQRLQVGRFVEV